MRVRKILALGIILMMGVGVIGCGQGNETGSQQNSEVSTDSSSEDSNSVQVDEGLINVTFTVPANMIGETTQDAIDETVENNGYISGTLNDDGSVTYVMSKKKQKEMLKETADNIDATLEGIPNSEDYPNITDVKANDDYTEFTVTTKSEELDLSESFLVLGFYMYGELYNMYTGNSDCNIHVIYINADTGNVITESDSSEMKSSDDTDNTENNEVSVDEIDISDIYSWYVGDIWNVFVDFDSYIYQGTDCTGAQFDPDFAYSEYLKNYELKDQYTQIIYENYADITETWDKMMEQVDLVNARLAEGYETTGENLELDLLRQYNDSFYDYYW